MFTDVQIINMGLGHIGDSRISNISPPRTSLERHVADGYPQWKRSELTSHRWVCAIEDGYALPLLEILTGVEKPYKYGLPTQCLRPIRTKYTEWVQRKRTVLSAQADLKISFIDNIPEDQFDPLFVDVLSWRIAKEVVEYSTQSNTKGVDADAAYEKALNVAKQMNAYVTGPEDVLDEDEGFEFLTSRYI